MKKKKSVLSVILSAVAWLLVIVLALIVVYMLFMRVSGKTPKVFGYTCLFVVTGSMEPTIETGSFILIHEVDPESLEKGDVITFVSEAEAIAGNLNTHRIIDVVSENGETLFQTQGDANSIADEDLVPAESVAGKYVCSLGFLSWMGVLLSSQNWFFILILVPAVLFFIFEIINVVKATKKNDGRSGNDDEIKLPKPDDSKEDDADKAEKISAADSNENNAQDKNADDSGKDGKA